MRWLGKQTWIPKGQDRLLRLLWSPNKLRHFAFDIDFFGMRYEGDLAHYIDWMVFAYGAAPYCELSLLEDLARELKRFRPEIHFYDVGANAGHHMLFMAPRADLVYAFEPYAELLPLLRQKISRNQLTTVTVVPCALGEEDASLDYFPGGGGNSGVGSLLPDEKTDHAEPIKVSVRKGDALFEEMHMPCIDLMKIDTEGFEPYVIRGLQKRIQRDRPAFIMEWSDRTRAGFQSEAAFREFIYPDAVLAEVTGRNGCRYRLRPFRFDSTEEAVVAPPELADFIRHQIH
jgi:FkbM family methyltransferase